MLCDQRHKSQRPNGLTTTLPKCYKSTLSIRSPATQGVVGVVPDPPRGLRESRAIRRIPVPFRTVGRLPLPVRRSPEVSG